ncbi:diguanylate cyclase [Candidatus Fermentibacteria bacterium]|nr:diguanylate cyclase [Candidatus Fermentibacteria bacterium]
MTDRLTGLPGRELLDELRSGFTQTRHHDVWTVMMIDVDQFKLINDAYGHLLGDLVLAEVGAAFRRNARAGDSVLRYGGDEFAAVFPATDVRGAMNFADRIMDAISRLTFPHRFTLTLSIGIAERLAEDASLDDVLTRADLALYQAKHAGRNRAVVFDPCTSRLPRNDLGVTDLVGRTREVRMLRQVLDEALAQGPRLAVIAGDVGVGKTRLADELARYGIFRGCLVHRGASPEFGQVEPYSFAATPIQAWLAALPDHQVRQIHQIVGPVHQASVTLLPGFPHSEQDGRFFTEDGLRFRVFDDLLHVIQAMAKVRPVLLVLDDAQWMPRHDLDLLAFLLRSLGDAPVAVAVTVRQGGSQPSDTFDFIRGLAGSIPSVTVSLGNLDADNATSLVTLALHDPAVPFEMLGTLYRQSGGNPLFLLELLRSLRDSGRIVARAGGRWEYRLGSQPALPASLAQTISRRLESLSEPTMRLLRTASLSERPFSVDLLTEVADRSELEVAECLEEALKAGIVAEVAGSQPLYDFAHGIVRSFIYRDLPHATRALLHARMGRFCERLIERHPDILSAVAHHYIQSTDTAKALHYALQAAKVAVERQATREALHWLDAYLARVEEKSAPRSDLLFAHRSRGEFLSLIGQGDAAEESLFRALELAEGAGDLAAVMTTIGNNAQKRSKYPDARTWYDKALALVPDAVGKADLLVSLVYLDYLEGRFSAATARLEEVRLLLQSAPQSPEILHLWAAYHKRMGDVCQEKARAQEALGHYDRSLELYRSQGDRIGESAVVNNMSSCYSSLGDSERSIDLLLEAARLNSQIDDALGLAIAHYNLAETYGSLNQVGLAREYYVRYMATSERIGNELGLGYGQFGLGYLAWLEGDLPAAEERYRAAVQVFQRLGTDQLAVMSRIRLAEVLFETGALDKGADELARIRESALEAVVDGDEVRCLEGMHMLLSPDSSADEAVEVLTRARASLARDDLPGLMRCSYFLARAQNALGLTEDACQTLDEALAVLGQHLERLDNHTYRTSMLHAREVRRVRDLYAEIKGTQWNPYAYLS